MRLLLTGMACICVGCDSCRYLDCIPRFDDFSFTYVDSNGNNLLSGSTPKYTLEDLEVYSIDSNNNEVFAYLQPSIGGDVGVNAQLSYSTERSFLRIKGEVKDTLDFSFRINKTKCCGEVSEIETTTLNGVVSTSGFPIEIVERD